jgi:hypothetical protein
MAIEYLRLHGYIVDKLVREIRRFRSRMCIYIFLMLDSLKWVFRWTKCADLHMLLQRAFLPFLTTSWTCVTSPTDDAADNALELSAKLELEYLLSSDQHNIIHQQLLRAVTLETLAVGGSELQSQLAEHVVIWDVSR